MRSHIFITLSIAAIVSACNPVGENPSHIICTGIHTDDMNGICHGQNRFSPDASTGSCKEPQCHGANLTGGNSGGYSCYGCHGDRWGIFEKTHTVTYGDPLSLKKHHRDAGRWPYYYCAGPSCHGVQLEGGKGPACSNCHDPMGGGR
jgi:hypothetical protein